MLTTLSIRNFVLIEDAVLELGPGLTVLTGETGAGKTLLTQALGLLRGERASEGLVGEGGDEALLQAVFEVGAEELALVPPDTVAALGLGPGEVIATRRLHRSGRNRCFVNGTAASLGDLGAVIASLVSFSGQHEHRRLLEPTYQRQVLDAFAGSAVGGTAGAYTAAWEAAREAAAALEAAATSTEERWRERELLAFQVSELEAARLDPEEEQALEAEQRMLARAEELLHAAAVAADLLRSEDGGADAGGLVGQARAGLHAVAGVAPDLDDIVREVEEAGHLLDDAVRGLRSFAASVSVDPARLQEVEERLRLYSDIGRKYGGGTSEAVSFMERGRARLDALEAFEDDLERSAARRDEAVAAALRLARELSQARLEAAPRLERRIESQLAELGMPESRVVVEVRAGEGWEALGRHGADTVTFLLSANPGLPPRSLAKTASGGELSRALLAIKAALAGLEGPETLVFDEIDAGIGGRTATAVGKCLWSLSRESQMIVVTHLPQVAVFGDHHVLIEKQVRDGAATTRLRPLDEAQTLEELCRMMGGRPGDPGALEHARTLRRRAAAGLID